MGSAGTGLGDAMRPGVCGRVWGLRVAQPSPPTTSGPKGVQTASSRKGADGFQALEPPGLAPEIQEDGNCYVLPPAGPDAHACRQWFELCASPF